MIKSRLDLEKNSDSALGSKKREDFEELVRRKIYDDNSEPDLQHMRDLVYYYKDWMSSNEDVTANRIIELFQARFPELATPKMCGTATETIDAAFEILNDNMSKMKRTKDLINRNKSNRERASMDVAKKNFDSIQRFSSTKKNDINGGVESTDVNMDFEGFLKDTIDREKELGAPSPKKRRHTHHKDTYTEDFYDYVKKKEEMKKRLDEYREEYDRHVTKKTEEREQQLTELLSMIPKLRDFMQKTQTQKLNENKKDDNIGITTQQRHDSSQYALSRSKSDVIDASASEKMENPVLYDL